MTPWHSDAVYIRKSLKWTKAIYNMCKQTLACITSLANCVHHQSTDYSERSINCDEFEKKTTGTKHTKDRLGPVAMVLFDKQREKEI